MIFLPLLLLALAMVIAAFPLDRPILLGIAVGITFLVMPAFLIANTIATPASHSELRFKNKEYQALFTEANSS